MRGKTLIGLGASLVLSAVWGCSGGDTGTGSSIAQTKGGSGGSGGEAGSLNLGLGAGGTGGGGTAGAAGSAGTGVAGAAGSMSQGGSISGSGSGGVSSGGVSSSGGSGGSKPAGMCKRVAGNDADCADFDPTTPQAYACDDPSVYSTLNGMQGGNCYSVNFVTGSKYGACCPP